MNFPALNIAWRSVRQDQQGLWVMALAVIVAVGAVSAVSFFTDRVGKAMDERAKELLAADEVIASTQAPRAALLQAAETSGLQTAVTLQFPSVLFHGEHSQLVEVKAVSDAYPLLGELRSKQDLLAEELTQPKPPAPGEVWGDARLLGQLHINLGQTLEVGFAKLPFSQLITYEPDQSGQFFQLAPRLLMNLADIEQSGLVTPLSRVRYRLLLAGSKTQLAEFATWFEANKQSDERLLSVNDARPELTIALDRAQRFLGLASLLSVLLGGLAVALAARHDAQRQTMVTALMRTLGARQAFVLQVYLWRLLLVGVLAGAVGGGLGFLAQAGLAAALDGWFAFALPAPSIAPLFTALAVAWLMLLGFALPSVLALGKTAPLKILRHELPVPGPSIWLSLVLAAAGMAGLMAWQARDWLLAVWAVGGLSAAFLLLFSLALILLRLMPLLFAQRGGGWRLALASLTRKPIAAALQLASIALGIMALVLLALVRVDLLSVWQSALPDDAPNHFMINIQAPEVAGLKDLFADVGIQQAAFFPMVRGRWVEHNQAPVNVDAFAEPQARNLATRDFNLSPATLMPASNELLAGDWHGESVGNALSLEVKFAQRLNVELGDSMTFDIGGRRLTGTVTSLREVAWDSFEVNFFVLGAPDLFAEFPASYLTSVYLSQDQQRILQRVARDYPSVTVLDVQALMRQVKGIMDQATLAIELVFGFTVLAGLMVLAAALQAGQLERQREAALLRTLGGRRSQLRAALGLEFALMGLLAAFMGVFLASSITALLASQVLNLVYVPNLWVLLLAALLSLSLVSLLGYGMTRHLTRLSPMRVFRGV